MTITRRYLPDTKRQLEALRKLLAAPPPAQEAPADPKNPTEKTAA